VGARDSLDGVLPFGRTPEAEVAARLARVGASRTSADKTWATTLRASPEGEKALIEVKAIEHPGQPFTITSNEEATARQEGDAYQLAIVRQAGVNLEVAFVRDPANRLELTRQCRQWVWECSSYDYKPERFLLE
jgi:hypothetical protein